MPPSIRTYNILVVEDNPGDAHLIEEAFAECGTPSCLTFADTLDRAREILQSSSFDLTVP